MIVKYKYLVTNMDKVEFKKEFKRITRQLSECQYAVEKRMRPDSYYQNKRKEFIDLIDNVIKSGWFKMPKKGTRIHSIYYDIWD